MTKWYKSKTKIGGVLIGLSLILGGVGKYLTGDQELITALTGIISGIGIVSTITGIRDAIEAYFQP